MPSYQVSMQVYGAFLKYFASSSSIKIASIDYTV